jgi:hypothetical protein
MKCQATGKGSVAGGWGDNITSGLAHQRSGLIMMTLQGGWRISLCGTHCIRFHAVTCRRRRFWIDAGTVFEFDYSAPTTFNNITLPSSSQNGGQGWNTSGTTAANDSGASGEL